MRKTVFRVCLLIWVVVCGGLIYAGYHDIGLGGAVCGAFFAGLLAVPLFAIGFGYSLDKDLFEALFARDYDALEKEYGPILKKTSVHYVVSPGVPKKMLLPSAWMSICEKALFLSIRKKSFCVPYVQYTIERSKNNLIIKDAIPEALADRIAPSSFETRRDLTIIFNNYPNNLDLVMSLVEQARQKQQNSQN